jgi:hypothetical protein
MIWFILSLLGGGSFVVTGLGVLFDSDCDTVSFGGGRAITATCYSATSVMSGEFPGWVAGLGMTIVGLFILRIGFRALAR